MAIATKRGYSPDDGRDFTGSGLTTMKWAAQDLYFLLNRGYPAKSASTFIGNHYLLSERQRVALTRVVSSERDIALRLSREKKGSALSGETVNIDGFNAIITLEVAQSGSPVFLCMDGSFRDLAGLRGTYRLIDKTDTAIRAIISELSALSVHRAVFWLDAPVSNSGRLKVRIADIAREENFEADVKIVNNVDVSLYSLENVVSSDSVILDNCPSWFNLNGITIPSVSGVWTVNII